MIVDLSKQRLNYDKIAHLYDEPIRDYDVDPNLVEYLAQRPSGSPKTRILDLGCGTGKQLTADASRLANIQLVGQDLFAGMLAIAQKRGPSVAWVQADNANPPFAQGIFDYITNQFNYQHVQQREKMIAALFRLLKPGGRFVMNNIDPWQMRNWLIYHFFPATWELDMQDFLPVERLVGLLETAGFTDIKVSRRSLDSDLTLREVYVYCSRRTAASQFMAIPDEDYAKGLSQLQKQIASLGSEAKYRSTFCFLTILADKA
jgi:SAM-dependent methyltransferase